MEHDGALPHFGSEVTTFLNWQLLELWFGRKWKGGGGDFWPISRSDGPRIFMWGFVKDEVYALPMSVIGNAKTEHYLLFHNTVIVIYCKVVDSLSNVFMMCAGQQVEHLNLKKAFGITLCNCLRLHFVLTFLLTNFYNYIISNYCLY